MKTIRARLSYLIQFAGISCFVLFTAFAQADVPQTKSLYSREEIRSAVEKIASTKRASETAAALAKPEVIDALTRYMAFLRVDPKNEIKFENVLSRLLNSSTEMIFCEDFNDWECLEGKPRVTPINDFRRETQSDLGAPVKVDESLNVEVYFTRRWANLVRNKEDVHSSLADQLANEIREKGKQGVYMALYGIDDLEGSLAPVYQAIEEKVANDVPVLGVFDAADNGRAGKLLRDYDVEFTSRGLLKVSLIDDLDYSYVKPRSAQKWVWGHPKWMDELSDLDAHTTRLAAASPVTSGTILSDIKWLMDPEKAANAVRMGFQYKETFKLMSLLNHGLKKNENAPARIEFPMQAIMHNKFVVLDSGRKKSVWTGTANVSKTCMGEETNANMAIVINHTAVANVFEEEFMEMHEFDPDNGAVTREKNLVTGRFHRFKRPNTKRYFKFNDGNEMRVHFAPTDDGEHRAILPMLLSAKKGDLVRISMFSGAGLELVRAMQFAASRGVKIRVLLDNKSGTIRSGWVRDLEANLFEKNPYAQGGSKIEVHLSAWTKNGLNHYKAATLSRNQGNGKFKTEVLIVGSQNWSGLGNDMNDENMVTIRNLKKGVEAGDRFNAEFDENLWPLSKAIDSIAPLAEPGTKPPGPAKQIFEISSEE